MSASYGSEQATPASSDAAEAMSRAIATIQFDIGDRGAFEAFRRSKIVLHLMDQAEKLPEAEGYLMGLSEFFSAADGLERRLAKEQRSCTGAEWQMLRNSRRLTESVCANPKNTTNRYIAAHIAEFTTADPARWERFEQRDPALVARYRAPSAGQGIQP